jgi:hypothetical protein
VQVYCIRAGNDVAHQELIGLRSKFASIAKFYSKTFVDVDRTELADQQQDATPHVNADGGISDSPYFDQDRHGRNAYAEGISTVSRAIGSPDTSGVCIGLYGRWGSGKSFLYNLIRQADEAWMERKLEERLKEVNNVEPKYFFIKCNGCSLQLTCNVIFLLTCCCFQTKD